MDHAKRSLEARLRSIRDALKEALGETWYHMDLMYTFEDAVIVKDYDSGAFYRIPYTFDPLAFGTVEEVDEVFILTALVESGMATDEAGIKVAAMKSATEPVKLTAMIVKRDDDRRIVFGPVLVPGEPDSDGDIVTAVKIEEVAHKFMSDYRVIDLDHTLANAAVPVESYLTRFAEKHEVEGETIEIPVGTWMMAVHVGDDGSWAAVKSGELGGFSIWACASENAPATAASAKASSGTVQVDGHSYNVVTLAELGDDWEVPAVSLVPTPAVPKAKFLAVKSKSPLAKLGDALRRWRSDVSTSQKASDTVVAESTTDVAEEVEMNEDQVKELVEAGVKSATDQFGETITSAVKEAVDPLVERLDALEAAAKAAEGEGEPAEGTEDTTALKAEVAELSKGLEQITKRLKLGGASRALKSEDDEGPANKPTSHRDGLGRSRRH